MTATDERDRTTITVRCKTHAEKKAVTELAAKAGLSTNAYILKVLGLSYEKQKPRK